jgi:hypothetical protein
LRGFIAGRLQKRITLLQACVKAAAAAQRGRGGYEGLSIETALRFRLLPVATAVAAALFCMALPFCRPPVCATAQTGGNTAAHSRAFSQAAVCFACKAYRRSHLTPPLPARSGGLRSPPLPPRRPRKRLKRNLQAKRSKLERKARFLPVGIRIEISKRIKILLIFILFTPCAASRRGARDMPRESATRFHAMARCAAKRIVGRTAGKNAPKT